MGVDDGLAPCLAHEVELRTVSDVRLRIVARVLRTVRLAVSGVDVVRAPGRQRRRIRELVHVTLCIRHHTRREAACAHAASRSLRYLRLRLGHLADGESHQSSHQGRDDCEGGDGCRVRHLAEQLAEDARHHHRGLALLLCQVHGQHRHGCLSCRLQGEHLELLGGRQVVVAHRLVCGSVEVGGCGHLGEGALGSCCHLLAGLLLTPLHLLLVLHELARIGVAQVGHDSVEFGLFLRGSRYLLVCQRRRRRRRVAGNLRQCSGLLRLCGDGDLVVCLIHRGHVLDGLGLLFLGHLPERLPCWCLSRLLRRLSVVVHGHAVLVALQFACV